MILAYDGTDYAGWQVQASDRTLQGTLEQALEKVTGQRVRVLASGRTDAGVHALGQVASCLTDCDLANDVLQRALNANLPRDMAVLEVSDVPERFHVIRDAVSKRYRYVIQNGPVSNVFARRYSWRFPRQLDETAMHRAATSLLGTHDFASFESSGSQRASSVRTITDIRVVRRRESHGEQVVIEIEADGFLYNMVRAIVGTLVEVGRGTQTEQWLAEVIAAQDRRSAGMTAPPQGLFLVHVEYPSCASLT